MSSGASYVAGLRNAHWQSELIGWGWMDATNVPIVESLGPGHFKLRVVRPASFGAPMVALKIEELWVRGPDALQLAGFAGAHASFLSWHAQFPGSGVADVRAERLDLDRRKPRSLVVHRHPFGEPHDVRKPVPLLPPEQWLDGIERIIQDITEY